MKQTDQTRVGPRRTEGPNALSGWRIAILVALSLWCLNSVAAQSPSSDSTSGRAWTVDYYNPADQKLVHAIETFHLRRAKARLANGDMTNVWKDIDYTLSHCPNHPEGLRVMSNLAVEHKQDDLAQRYFDTAVAFSPADYTVRILYAIHSHRLGNHSKALTQYEEALAINPNSPEAHYQLGLLYTDTGQFAQAKPHAKRAYDLGYSLPGLRDRLAKAGYWP